MIINRIELTKVDIYLLGNVRFEPDKPDFKC